MPGDKNQSVAQNVSPTGEHVTTNAMKKLILPHQVKYRFNFYRKTVKNLLDSVKLIASRTGKLTGYSGPHWTLEFDGFTPLIYPVTLTGHGEPGHPNPCGLSLKFKLKSDQSGKFHLKNRICARNPNSTSIFLEARVATD